MGIKKKITQFFLDRNSYSSLFIYCAFLLVSFVIYRPAFSSYFFQDDWFTFQISKANNFKEFVEFFIPRTDVIYYRPLGMQIYFFIMKLFFGFEVIFYRLVTLLIYSLNGLLMYKLYTRFKLSKLASFLGASLFVGSAATYIPFYWSATFPFVLGPLFFISSLLTYLSNKKIVSFILYILGIFTLEIIFVLPFILVVWELLFNKGKGLKIVALYFLPIVPYLLLRLFIFPVQLTDSYSPHFKILATLRSYFFWTFNWPEEIDKAMAAPFFINPDFIKNFHIYLIKWISTTAITILVLVVIPVLLKIKKFIKKKSIKGEKISIFAILIYFFGLGPLVFFGNHVYPYYLPVALIGFILFLSQQFEFLVRHLNIAKNAQIILLIFVLISWVWASITTIHFNSLIHWAPNRAKLSRKAITYLSKFPIDNVWEVYADVDYKLPLMDQHGIKAFFAKNIKTTYSEEVPSGISTSENIIFLNN